MNSQTKYKPLLWPIIAMAIVCLAAGFLTTTVGIRWLGLNVDSRLAMVIVHVAAFVGGLVIGFLLDAMAVYLTFRWLPEVDKLKLD